MTGPIAPSLLGAARFVGGCLVTLGFWVLWLGLAIVLAFQGYVVLNRQLELPHFALRALETRLAESGVHATFGRTVFDPSGRVVIEDVSLQLPNFEEPLVTARAVYLRVSLWRLLLDRFEPLELRLTGASFRVPAFLSASGRTEAVVRDLDAAMRPKGNELVVQYLTCRLDNLTLAVRGDVHLSAARRGPARRAPLPLAEFLVANYAALSREFAGAVARLRALDRPMLRAELTSSESHGAMVRAVLLAQGFTLGSGGAGIRGQGLVASGRFPLLAGAEPVTVEAAMDDVRLPRGAEVHGAQLEFQGRFDPARLKLEPGEATADLGRVDAAGLTVEAAAASAALDRLPRVRADLRAELMGGSVFVEGTADVKARAAEFHGDAGVSRKLAQALTARFVRAHGPFLPSIASGRVSGEVRLAPGWKFQEAAGRVSAEGIRVNGVTVDSVRGAVTFDGRRLSVSDLVARAGENLVRGRFEQDFAGRSYRFLLAGRLRPLFLEAWFPAWWRQDFDNFQFPGAPPDASLDLRGRWGKRRAASAFLFVDSRDPVVRGLPFDRIRTRIFFRPGLVRALDVYAAQGPGVLRGAFERRTDRQTGAWERSDFDLVSSLDLGRLGPAAGPLGERYLALATFASPPTIKATGRLDGPAAPAGPHRNIRIAVVSPAEMRIRDFPLESAAFTVDVRDSFVSLKVEQARFAGGTATGGAELSGAGPDRRLEFTGTLKQANLDRAVATLVDFTARRQHRPPAPPSAFLKERAGVVFDLSAGAAGRYGDPFSYRGSGSATLTGAGLGQVRMLGLLSELLRFTSLRFTSAKADFEIEGKRLAFPDVIVTGANSRIQAKGNYDFDQHHLDFTAKIFPFQQSKLLPQQLVGAVLTPLSVVLEVKLTGSVEKPKWVFVNGPINMLRNLIRPAAPAKTPAPAPAGG